MVLWRSTRPSRTNTPKRYPFHCRDWNAKVGSQEIPGVTGKFGLGVQDKAGQRLTEFCQENALVIANILFQQYKRRLYTWTSPDDQYQNQIDYILCSQRWKSSIKSAKTKSGADCGSDHKLLSEKFRHKLKNLWKTIRPFSSVQSLSHVRLSVTPWITTCQASLSITISWSSLTLMSFKSVAVQPSHPLLSPSPPGPNPSQHQSLFQWVNSSHEVAKVLEFQLWHHSLRRTPRADLL